MILQEGEREAGMKIKTKIILIYISVVMFSFLISSLFFVRQNRKIVRNQLGGVAMQTMQALNENLNLIIENVTQFSNLIYFDDTIQKKLAAAGGGGGQGQGESKEIQKSLVNMLLSGDYISSVEIFDRFDKHYLAYKRGPMSLKVDKVKEASWYDRVSELNGDILFVGGDEAILYYRTEPEKRMISLIRTIADIDTYDPLATLIINIDETTFQEHFKRVGMKYHSRFCIINSKGEYIVKSSDYEPDMDKYVFNNQIGPSGYQIIQMDSEESKDSRVRKDSNKDSKDGKDSKGGIKSGKNRMILTQQELGIQDWKLVGFMPVERNIYLSDSYNAQLFLIIVINLAFVFICTLYLTKLIFEPLNNMEEYMRKVEDGEFVRIPMEHGKQNEMEHLKRGFNRMVHAIERLLSQVKEEERVIRKNELDLIQQQITPHFLNNTLDAISALVLIHDTDRSFLMLQSLGRFYRNNLNSGRDLVKVKDEIECIKSYITILNIRYEDKIIMEYDVEEEIMEEDILKLLLQPIVENAVHHGIRGKEGQGTISIKGYRDEGEIIFIITDDGLGMSEERIEEVMEEKLPKDRPGFGLYSAKQRISLFYNIKNPLTINSEIDSGTEITVCVNIISKEMGRLT